MKNTVARTHSASERKGHGEKLSRKSDEAIRALITEPTIKAAAEKVGISERTLRRWLQNPDFYQRYQDERSISWTRTQGSWRRLQSTR